MPCNHISEIKFEFAPKNKLKMEFKSKNLKSAEKGD